jgi:predicted DNA-binding transcriptional regulator AlpA
MAMLLPRSTDMTDGQESIFYTKKEMCKVTKLSPAHIDRLERAGRFPQRFSLTDAPNGKAVWLKAEVHEWCLARSRRKLKPPADGSVDEAAAHLRF